MSGLQTIFDQIKSERAACVAEYAEAHRSSEEAIVRLAQISRINRPKGGFANMNAIIATCTIGKLKSMAADALIAARKHGATAQVRGLNVMKARLPYQTKARLCLAEIQRRQSGQAYIENQIRVQVTEHSGCTSILMEAAE